MSAGTCKLWAGKMYLIFSARGPYISEGETDCMTVNVHQLLQPILFNILINARFETVNSRTCMCSLINKTYHQIHCLFDTSLCFAVIL